MSKPETPTRRRQRVWFNAYIESLAEQVKNLALNHPGDAARVALNAAAELLRREKKDAPGIVSAAEARATALQKRNERERSVMPSRDALFDGSNAHLLNEAGDSFE